MAMMQQQQVVVMQQPAGSDAWGIQNTQMWSSGICGCFDDCGICICGWCCPCILECRIASALGEPCCPFCVNGGHLGMRSKTRYMYGIEGSICKDFWTICCCQNFEQCQMARELKIRGRMA